MKVLVTGATGYVGHSLTMALARQGNEVNILVRNPYSVFIPRHRHIRVFTGDITDKTSILPAMKGCERVFHTAALVHPFASKPAAFYHINTEGTRHVMDVALQTGVEKLVYTSSCGVIGPSQDEPLNEKDACVTGFKMDYDLSKKMGEDIVFEYAKKGINAVVVYPSKIYGPGNVSHSFTANAVIEKFLKNRLAFIPSPGAYKVCFAFIDDIINGHLLAMEKGKSGEKYILGGTNISYLDFFERILTLSSCKGRIIQLSKNTIKVWACLQMLKNRIAGGHLSITRGSIDYVFNNYTFSSEKAIIELGYKITSLDEALRKTILFLNKKTN